MNIKKGLINKGVLKGAAYGLVLVVMMLFFNTITNNIFLTQRNLTLLMRQGSSLMVLSSVMLLLLVSKNTDLSAGAAVYFVGVVISKLTIEYNVNLFLALAIAMIAGILMGMLNGVVVGFFRLPAFIATLATQMVFRGIGYSWTNAATIGPVSSTLTYISEGYVNATVSLVAIIIFLVVAIIVYLRSYRLTKDQEGSRNKLIKKVLATLAACLALIWICIGYKGIPMAVVFAGIVAMAIHFIVTKTVFGRHIYILGGNTESARLAGIKVEKRVFQSYVLMGIIYALAGILVTARLGGSAATAGNLMELDAVAACAIGGTSMTGGVGSIKGVVLGVFVLSAIDNVMSLMNVSSYAQMYVKGIILLIAVCFDIYSNLPKYKKLMGRLRKSEEKL